MLAIQGKAHFANPDARAKHVASRRRQLMHAGHGTHRPSQIGLRARCSLQPQLANIPTSAIRSRIGVSRWYAGRIRQGYRPVPQYFDVEPTAESREGTVSLTLRDLPGPLVLATDRAVFSGSRVDHGTTRGGRRPPRRRRWRATPAAPKGAPSPDERQRQGIPHA